MTTTKYNDHLIIVGKERGADIWTVTIINSLTCRIKKSDWKFESIRKARQEAKRFIDKKT